MNKIVSDLLPVEPRQDYAMITRTRRLEPFSLEDMAQMTAARRTGDFDACHAPALVFVPDDCAGDGCKRRG